MRRSYVHSVITNVNGNFCWFPANFELMCAICCHFIRSSREYYVYYFGQSPNYAVPSWLPIFDFRFLNFPCFVWAVQWLMRWFSGFLRRRHRFIPTPVHMAFVVDDMALQRVYFRVLGLCLVSITARAHLYVTHALLSWQLAALLNITLGDFLSHFTQ